MRTTKRRSATRSRAKTVVKATGLALFMLAGAPVPGDLHLPTGTPVIQAAAMGASAKRKRGWWIFSSCTGKCRGHGKCCGISVV